MNPRQLIKSFGHAGRGMKHVFEREQNFRLQLLIGSTAVIFIFVFGLSKSEAIVILLMIMAVLVLELLNSALEEFVDLLKPRLHYQVEVVKDIMAAMVLIASVGSLVVGTMIFLPYLLEWIII